jgi:hypothetical protein
MGGFPAGGPPATSCISVDSRWCDPCAVGSRTAEIRALVASGWRQGVKTKDSALRSISRLLAGHALHACPPRRAKWIVAAANELDSMASSYESLIWSLGTVWASYQERFYAMSATEPQLPRLLLALEVLTCFMPSSFLWVWTFKATANHVLPAFTGSCLATAAAVGPVGLAFFGQIALGISGSRGRYGSVVLTFLAGWNALVILLLPGTPTPFKELPWRDCVLLIVLPLIGTAHYAFLEREARAHECPRG